MLENFSSCCFFGRIAMCKFLTWSTIAFSSKFIAGSPCSLFDNGLMITSLVLFLDWRRVFWTSDILCIDRLQDNPIRFKSLSRSDDLLRYSIFFILVFIVEIKLYMWSFYFEFSFYAFIMRILLYLFWLVLSVSICIWIHIGQLFISLCILLGVDLILNFGIRLILYKFFAQWNTDTSIRL